MNKKIKNKNKKRIVNASPVKKVSKIFKNNNLRNHNSKNNNDKIEVHDTSSDKKLKQLEEFFLQGRKEYINLFRGCPVALAYTNIDGIILQVNRCFEELTGFSEEEAKGNSIVYCLRPEEASYFDLNYNRTSFETNIYTKDDYTVQILGNRRYNKVDNRLAGMIFSFQDISFLRKERRLKQALYRISQLTHSELSLLEIYPQVQEQLKKVIVAENFYIALRDSEKGQIHFPYYTDEAAGDNEIFIQRYCSSQSIFHYILKNAKPVLMDFQRYRKMLSYGYIEPWDVMTNTHLWLAVPIKDEQKVIGVLALQSYNNARLYSEKDIDLLEFVAQQLSAAILRKSVQDNIEKERITGDLRQKLVK